MNISNRHS